jgi:methionyl-tRNA synthetase
MAVKTFYLTTPIYYVNARPHIGHAYSTIVADVLARRHRLLGDDTYFLTGTDEHGQKIERAAAAAGIPPQQYADQVSKTFSDLWARMGITHDQFIRTTDPNHKRGVQKLFADLYAKGQIYLSSYTGQYSVGEEMFVEGPPGTIGPDGRPTETVTEENFFFRLSDYQLPLLNLIESNELVITPDSSRNEVLNFLRGPALSVINDFLDDNPKPGVDYPRVLPKKELDRAIADAIAAGKLCLSSSESLFVPGALRDLSISRSSFTWGIPVPEEIQAKEKTKEEHVIYVWLDALANYMTALGYGSDDDTLWQTFWPADLHLVGKEITRFHCIYWPAFLLAAGLPVPKQVTANGWLLFDNSKMSKSKGNVVRTETILDAFGTLCPPPPSTESENRRGTGSAVPSEASEARALAPEVRLAAKDRDLFAADILRYYLLREIPFGQDGSFSFDSLITRYNADLANGYGNLVSRTLKMISDFCASKIPQGTSETSFVAIFDPFTNCPIDLGTPFFSPESSTNFFKFLEICMAYVSATDNLLTEVRPWKLHKESIVLHAKNELTEDRQRQVSKQINDALYTAAESIRIITALLYPILPFATARVWAQLGLGDIELAARTGDLKNLQWGGLKPGTKLGPLAPIFPRADKGLAQIMTNLENPEAPTPRPEAPLKSAMTPASPAPIPTSSFDPAAGPRTASLTETGPLPVAGSTAHTTRTGPTPSHTEAQASGIFAQPPASTEITIDDFAKIELRVAQITLAERIPKADKLLRLEVDLGPLGTRQILSGIAEHYTPEDLTGRKIVVITNLAPRKMRGLESHGMLLAASDGDHGKPILATFAEDIPNGTRLK